MLVPGNARCQCYLHFLWHSLYSRRSDSYGLDDYHARWPREPVGDIRSDTISYHYLGPRVWLRDGVIRPVLDESFDRLSGHR